MLLKKSQNNQSNDLSLSLYDLAIECAAKGAVKYIKTITNADFIQNIEVLKNKAIPATNSNIPKDVAFVVACILLYKSLNRSRPIAAIKINTEPNNINIEVIKVISFQFLNMLIQKQFQ